MILDCFLKLVQVDIWTSSVVLLPSAWGAEMRQHCLASSQLSQLRLKYSLTQPSNHRTDYRQLRACILANFDVGSCRFT